MVSLSYALASLDARPLLLSFLLAAAFMAAIVLIAGPEGKDDEPWRGRHE